MRTGSSSANSPAIVYNGNLVPAGSSVDFGVTTPIDLDAHYFAVLFSDDSPPRDDSKHGARARKAATTDDLVLKHLLSAGQTIVSVDVPAEFRAFGPSKTYTSTNARAAVGHSTYLTCRSM